MCIIANRYPNKYNPSAQVFVQQLTWAFADLGIESMVVCPVAANIFVRQGLRLPFKISETTSRGSKVTVFFPRYIGFGQMNLGIMNTANLNLIGYSQAVRKVIKSFMKKPDVLYGHFISPAGVTVARIGREFDIPAFVAYGESSPWSIKNIGLNKVIHELKTISGVITVSTKNKNDLKTLGIVKDNKVKVFPNAVRPEHFYPRDKIESRKKFGLPLNEFIVAFVGHFIGRKGISNVAKAVEKLEGVYAIYAGKGPLAPRGKKTLYCSLVNPSDMPWFYSAADVFVLPTINEGCCNAIVEAMACGLPIISSNLPFNDDILDDTCSIRVDPNKVEEITTAIKGLYKNKNKLKELQSGSLDKAKSFTLTPRANKILDFIDMQTQEPINGKNLGS